MRPRKKDRHLPACMYQKHGAYYLVRKGKWLRLGTEFQASLAEYAMLLDKRSLGGMPKLIDDALEHMRTRTKPALKPNTLKQYEAAAERLKENFADFEPREDECGEACACREYGFPAECYRKMPILGTVTDEVSTQSTDTENVSRHQGVQT